MEALLELAEQQPGLKAALEAEQAAAAERAGGAGMVTLAVEGNISAGKSTFLNVLSHQDTCLHDILKVGLPRLRSALHQAFLCLVRMPALPCPPHCMR